ncbi:flavo protein [Testicularia cyperi]|uniref:Flavo protein n=1 Tax=Testicularia cyperi TaxID=1882483 RepID=A0A317XV18_9BASI|nr:flavo protein [Testicularia cyperi]
MQPSTSTSNSASTSSSNSAMASSNTPGNQHDETLPKSLRSPYPPLSKPPLPTRPLHIVLASTGSVASIKIPLIVQSLLRYENVRIQIIATQRSLHFYDREAIRGLDVAWSAAQEEHSDASKPVEGRQGQQRQDMQEAVEREYTVADLAEENQEASNQVQGAIDGTRRHKRRPRVKLWTDTDEWGWRHLGEPILHIELRRWCDVVLVAPCSANTLAKIVSGVCDDLLTSFIRALSPGIPKYLFPAMNTLMFLNPLTERQISEATGVLGWTVRGPVEKTLACGDVGKGAMYEWSDIVALVVERYGLRARAAVESR